MNAIVPYRRRPLGRGAQRVAQLDSGGLAVDVRVERVDKRNRCIWYSLKLGSRDVDVTGRLIAERKGASEEVGSVLVAAGSMGSARFAVTTPRSGAYRAMYLEICSTEMMLRVDAPRPPAASRFRPIRAALAMIVIGLAVSGGAAVPLALSQQATLAAPARALAGTRVHLPYAGTGFGSTAYLARADDGTLLAERSAAPRTGEIAFALPPRLAGHRVTVTLATRAPWSSLSRSTSFVVVRPDAATSAASVVARVLSFSARRDVTASGETVLASYLAVAERGTIQLVDEAGKIVRAVPFRRVGTTRIAVPPAYRNVPLLAELTVHRAGTRAEASVAIPPLAVAPPAGDSNPADDAAPSDTATGEAITPIGSSASLESGGLISVAGRAVAGHPLRLRIAAQPAPMQLELEDESGTAIAQTQVAAGSTNAELALPPAAVRTNYLLSVHYTRNGGEETIIRTLAATPH